MPTHLDFLVALDDHLRNNHLDYLVYGHELYNIAQAARLCEAGSEQPAQWAGELVSRGYVTHSRLSAGDRRPLPDGPYSAYDVRRVSDYGVTYEGRTEAERVRRQRREELTDAALCGVVPNLLQPWMSEVQRRAISTPLSHLRAALDNEQIVAAVGAAKDLTEAACKVAIEHARGTAPSGDSLPSLFKEALALSDVDAAYAEVGRSLAATVQRLAELRNAVGAGHGRAAQPDVDGRAARLAGSAATGIALFLLAPSG